MSRPPSVFVEVGQRFGRLVVTQTGLRAGRADQSRGAMCRCDCGAEVIVPVTGLANGNRKSCGCLAKESSFSAKARAAGIAWANSPEGRVHAAGMRAGQTPEQAARRDANGSAAARSAEGRARASGLRSRQTPEQVARREANQKPPPVIYVHGLAANPLYHLHATMMRRCYKEDWPGYWRYGGTGIKVCDEWHDVARFIADIESTIGPRPEGRYPSGLPLYSLDRWPDKHGNYENGNVRWATVSEQALNRRRLRR